MDQLELDERPASHGDCTFNLDDVHVERLQVQLSLGPKGAFRDEAVRPPWCLLRAVYDDAALYDVAYYIGQAPRIDESFAMNGVKFSSTCITYYLTEITGDRLKGIPDLPPEVWSSPPAIARQVRAFLEHHADEFRTRIGWRTGGGYEVRISLCTDGAVAAVDWGAACGYSFLRHENLSRAHVLGVLGWKEYEISKIRDVADFAPDLTGNIHRAVFVRVWPRNGFVHNAIVFNAVDPPSNARPYWRIPPRALKNPGGIINLIAQTVRYDDPSSVGGPTKTSLASGSV
jgi:hypothetical protein